MSLPEGTTALGFVLTSNRARAIRFYTEVMGFALRGEDDFAATLDMAGLIVRLSDVPDHAPSPHPVLGWTVPDIVAAGQALIAKGVTFHIYPGMGQDEMGIWSAPDGRAKVSFFSDSEGNLLSLTEVAVPR
jgi:catechol 2,3-dioxygenase-like lactoylglutathione lyase family enzyme